MYAAERCSKMTWPTQDLADMHVYSLVQSKRARRGIHSYFCGFCNGWHVGHDKNAAR